MKIKLIVLSPWLLFLFGALSVCTAQTTIDSFLPPTEGGPAPDLANYSDGFELYGNGIYWWQGYSLGGEFDINAEIGFTGYATTNAIASRPVYANGLAIAGAAADSEYFYFADNQSGQIYSKSIWAQPSDPAVQISTPFTPPPNGYSLGAVMLWNGLFYWSDYNGTTFNIMSVNPYNPSPQLVRSGSGNKIIKMQGFNYNSSVFTYTEAIFALTSDGVLFRMDLSPTNSNNVVLATGVTDFTIRDESEFFPPFSFSFFTTVYASTGLNANVNSSTPPGTLLSINAASGATTTIYTAPGQDQITSVTTDVTNIYWTQQPITCNSPFGCLLGDYSIYRQSRPADHSTSPGSVDLIGFPGGGAGVNLRSDGDWLYFLNGTSIKRIAADAPKLQFLDVEALGLEVVQAIQNLDSQVPLVANRPTYVRGYAYVDVYNTRTWFSTAVLHGFRNGVEFSDSPIFPVSTVPLLGGYITLPQLRGDTQHTFLFKLPASWVQGGPDLPASLTFTMTANPDLEIPETSASPLSNNTVSLLAPAILQAGLTPNLITVPLVSKEGSIYYFYSGGIGQILQRALSLLPAENLDAHFFLVPDPVGDWNNPYDFGNTNYNISENAWNNACNDVGGLHLWSDPYQGDDEHFVGMLPPAALAPGSPFTGIADRPGNGSVVTMDTGFGRGHSASGGTDMAHELGHNYGRLHIDCGDFTNYPDQEDFYIVPYPCSLGNPDTNLVTATYGYDPIDNVVWPPNAAPDLMSYASVDWVSAITWDLNLGVLPLMNAEPTAGSNAGSTSPPSSGLVMLVNARLNPEDSAASLAPFYIVPENMAPAQVLADSRRDSGEALDQTNPVYVVFYDGGGNVLSQVAVAVEDADGNDFDLLHIGQYVDIPGGVQSVQLVQSGQVLAERFLSPNPPVLTLGTLAVDPVTDMLSLNWLANDPDGDPLVFTLQYSADNGTTWKALRTDYPYLSITFSTSLLPGGTQCLLRVIATDGANTASAMTHAFTIPLHPPMPFIDGVTAGQQFSYGSPASLTGIALDAQNGSSENQLNWILSGPTPLTSSNSTLSLSRLSPGNYTATLTATDLGGMTGNAVTDFEILPPLVPDGPAYNLDGYGDSGGFAGATYIPLPLPDGSLASVRLFHTPGMLYASFAGLEYGSNGTPASVGLQVDPTATPPATPGTNDFGFFVNENGLPLEEQGNGVNIAVTLTPPPGFATAIYRGPYTWSADLSIPDNQLGGWGHLATLMLEHGPVLWPPSAVTEQPRTWAQVYLGTNAPPGTNLVPVANAGSNLSISLTNSQTLTLNGSGSFDSDGDALTYAWTQISGPSVFLTGANTIMPTFIAAPVVSATTLTFQLVVNDGTVSSTPSQVQITLLPPLPQTSATQPRAGATLRSDGTLELRLVGTPDQPYQIQASSNLVTWVNLNTVYSDYAGRIAFAENSDRTNYSRRFYRWVIP